MKKLLTVAFVVGFLGALSALPAKADAIYTYTGNDLTGCSGCYVSLSFTLPTALGDNLNESTTGNITADVTVFTISDNDGNTLTQTSSFNDDFLVSTSSTGTITAWDISACGNAVGPFSQCISTENDANAVSDASDMWLCVPSFFCGPIAGNSNTDDAGSAPALDGSTSAPENSTTLLLTVGLLALGLMVLRRPGALRFVPSPARLV